MASACSPWEPREVQAAEPRGPAAPEAVEPRVAEPLAPREALPAPEGSGPLPPAVEVDEVADLAALVARLADPEAPPLVLAEAEVERLFHPLERATSPILQASHAELDVVGDESVELVVVVSDGGSGEGFWMLLLEPLAGAWRVTAQTRVDGPCRSLPQIGLVTLADRRWISALWIDSLSGRARTLAQALIEPFEGQLEPVHRMAWEGHLPGGPTSLAVSFTLDGAELDAVADGVDLRLDYTVSATADQTGLGPLLWAAEEVAMRLRQPAPGQPFVPAEPAGVRAVDADLLATWATRSWFQQTSEQTARLAQEGRPAQQLVLLELAEGLLELGGSPEARALIGALPPRDELEAAAAIR